MKKVSLLLIVVFVSILKLSTAQIVMPLFPKADDFSDLKSSKLIVGLMDTTDKNDYFSRMYNKNIIYAIQTYWSFSKYEIGNISDYIEMKNAKEDVYLIVPIEIERINFDAKPFTNDSYYSNVSCIQIGKAKDLKIKKKLLGKNYSLSFNRYTLMSASSSFEFLSVCASIKEMQFKIDYTYASKEEKKELGSGLNVTSKLKDKTLLIDRRFVCKGETEAKLKEVYKYDVKIVNPEEIVLAVQNKDKSKAYIQFDPLSLDKEIDYLMVKACDDLKYVYVTSSKRGACLKEGVFMDINKAIDKK